MTAPIAVVNASGGATSWGAAVRAVARWGAENVALLFADTKIEDPDLYRFLRESAALTGARLVEIADGRHPWEVFRDERFIWNSRIDPCSKILKRQLCARWRKENAPESVVVLGLDWTEGDRVARSVAAFAKRGVTAWCPMAEPPYRTKDELLAELQALGVRPSALYEEGFAHNNCGGFCVKAGHGQFAHLLRMRPDTYAWHEAQEEETRRLLGKDVTVLRWTDRGEVRPITLREFRERIQAGGQVDLFDLGGCGCFDSTEIEA